MGTGHGHEAGFINGLAQAAQGDIVVPMAISHHGNNFAEAQGLLDRHSPGRGFRS